jgi:hypothetical protein
VVKGFLTSESFENTRTSEVADVGGRDAEPTLVTEDLAHPAKRKIRKNAKVNLEKFI